MSSDPLLLSLKSWPDDNPQEKSVSSLISRIQAQRGHFRDVDESILEAEIASGKDTAGLTDEANNGGSGDPSGAAVTEEVDRATELRNAKTEMTDLVAYDLRPVDEVSRTDYAITGMR